MIVRLGPFSQHCHWTNVLSVSCEPSCSWIGTPPAPCKSLLVPLGPEPPKVSERESLPGPSGPEAQKVSETASKEPPKSQKVCGAPTHGLTLCPIWAAHAWVTFDYVGIRTLWQPQTSLLLANGLERKSGIRNDASLSPSWSRSDKLYQSCTTDLAASKSKRESKLCRPPAANRGSMAINDTSSRAMDHLRGKRILTSHQLALGLHLLKGGGQIVSKTPSAEPLTNQSALWTSRLILLFKMWDSILQLALDRATCTELPKAAVNKERKQQKQSKLRPAH